MAPGSTRRGRRSAWRAAVTIGVSTMALTALSATGSTVASAAPATMASVDPTSQLSVRNAYQRAWFPATQVASGWSGSTAPCLAGRDSAAAQSATLGAVNFARELTGRADVTMSRDLSALAIKAALIQDASNKVIAHPLPRNSTCWTRAGAAAAAKSGLVLGTAPLSPGDAVAAQLSGAGTHPDAIDARRWLLYSRQSRIGSGTTARANALYVQDSGSFLPAPTGSQAAAWPSAGWFPGQLVPDSNVWSVSIPGADFTSASVVIGHLGASSVDVDAQAGDSTIAWLANPRWDVSNPVRPVTVLITGIRIDGKQRTLKYQVTLFDATVGLANRNVISYPWPGYGWEVGSAATANASNNNGLPVSYTSNSPGVCTVSGATISMVHRGTCSVTASVPHDDRFPEATPQTRTYGVG